MANDSGGTGALHFSREPQADGLHAKRAGDSLLHRVDPADGSTTAVGDTGIPAGGGLARAQPPGFSHATDALVEDVPPASLGTAAWTCAASPGATCANGSGSPMSTLATIPPRGSVIHTVTMDLAPSARGNLVNEAVVAAPVGFADLDPTNDSSTDADALTPVADLAISQVESADPVLGGSGVGNLTYLVTVENSGPADASWATGSEILGLPAGVIVESVAPSRGSWADPIRTLGDLGSGASATLTVSLTVSAAADPGTDVVSAMATVASVAETDPGSANDSAGVMTSVAGETNLALALFDDVDPVAPGWDVTFTYEVTNHGPSDSMGSEIFGFLPPGLAFAGSGNGCELLDGVVRCPVGPIALATTASVGFVARVEGQGSSTVVQSATLIVTGIDPSLDDNVASESTTIDAEPPQVILMELLRGGVATPVNECDELREPADRVRLTFNEELRASDPTSYSLVEAGVDRDLSTVDCVVAVDDVPKILSGVSYDPGPSVALIDLASPLGQGLHRFAACGLTDLTGNSVDFGRQLRLVWSNLLRNGHLDCALPPWIGEPSDEVAHVGADVDGASASGSVALANTAGSENLSVDQCVEIQGLPSLLFSSRLQADVSPGESVYLTWGCFTFDEADCGGAGSADSFAGLWTGDTFGEWTTLELVIDDFPQAASALCSVSVRIASGQFAEVLVDTLSLKELPLFADGFESGDTAAWSDTMPK